MSIPTAFDKRANFVCDALRWLTAPGKIVHIASISKTLTPYGMFLTAAGDIQMHMEKTSLDYVPLAIMRSPALLYDVCCSSQWKYNDLFINGILHIVPLQTKTSKASCRSTSNRWMRT